MQTHTHTAFTVKKRPVRVCQTGVLNSPKLFSEKQMITRSILFFL